MGCHLNSKAYPMTVNRKLAIQKRMGSKGREERGKLGKSDEIERSEKEIKGVK